MAKSPLTAATKRSSTGDETASRYHQGKRGKPSCENLRACFGHYADGSALKSVALKAAMVMPALFLQKAHPRSKAKDHVLHLKRRLQQWSDGELESLTKEGRNIQHQFTQQPQNRPTSVQKTAQIFAKLMMEGKVRAAPRLIA